MFEAVKEKIEAEIVSLVSQNEHLLKDFAGQKASDLVNDDAAMRDLALRLYGLLPAMLKSIVGQDIFIAFVLDNRQRLIEAITAATQEPGGKGA
ncbi:hypothetical protein AB4Z10_25760 [Bosea sp. RAF48]|uniref:hypothetical protein n=1 Tax=Bosea sp. RAF48 TaxID=3237480 RepID=UPI003F8F0F91